MNYESFDYSKKDGVGHLILNKGEEFNKMTLNFWYELPRVLDEIKKDTSLRVLILSSTGKHFCAGMDLANFGTFKIILPCFNILKHFAHSETFCTFQHILTHFKIFCIFIYI